MRGLWLRLLRGGGSTARLEIGLPMVAGGVITFVLLLMLGLQQGLSHRADRTAWRTPEAAAGEPTVLQAGFTDYFGERPITVVDLAALTPDPPDVPGTDGFPAPGEVWASPALAELIEELPANQLANRFPAPVTRVLPEETLEYPGELFAVIGRELDDPTFDERAPHLWMEAMAVTPTRIDRWSTTPDLYQTVYAEMALLAVFMTALPLAGLGGLASRLMAGRRQRRLATLRLLGASTSQLARLTITELATFAGIGAVIGAVLHLLVLPLVSRIPIKGGPWFPPDVEPGALLTLGTMAAVVLMLTLGALSGILPSIRDPLGSYRRARPSSTPLRWWSVLLMGAAVALFWLRSSNPLVPIVFTGVVFLGWGLFSTGPLIIGGLGRLLARRAHRPATLLAGRFLADSPDSAWRTVSGFSLAAFLAATLPLGLRGVGDFENRADRLEAVAPAATIETRAAEARAVLGAADIQADVEITAAPFWLDEAEWATLTLTVNDPEVERERARTTMIESGLWGPEMQMAEDLPTKWLVLDGVVIGVVVMPIAALVALATMVIGTIARIYDRREALIALRLAGTAPGVLSSAQRYELVLPTALVGTIAAIAGLISGSTSGGVSLLNAYSAGIFAGLFSIGAIALWLAGRASHPVLERVSTDLTERE
ncbi:MAG: hypothetical protein C3F10_12080 [Dehalococcoidia bacterium]|nr:MAG: hypothetical protein C3F10_12080 [Dehalococcoidia bacterium]